MFIKTNENDWINLDLCKKVQIQQTNDNTCDNTWKIVFLFVNAGPVIELNGSLGPFESELEAQEVLDIIWSAKNKNDTVWTPYPESIFKVTIQDIDYSDWSHNGYSPFDVFLQVICKLDIDKVKDLDLSVDGVPLITGCRDPRRAQREWSNYYITSGINLLTMKNILQDIGKKLDKDIIVDITLLTP